MNVVFILVDDLGWKDLSCYGSSFHETPNIDALASESTVFTSAYAASPVCSPTRAAIVTGKHPTRIGITDWIPGSSSNGRLLKTPEDYNELPLQELTLAEVLKQRGYNTFFAGKWHLGDIGFFPENQGFDINIGGIHRGQPPGGYYSPYSNPKLSDGPDGEYLTDRLTNEAIGFLEAQKGNPFLLYLSYYSVHTPIQGRDVHFEGFEEKKERLTEHSPIKKEEGTAKTVQNQCNIKYASMLYALDENIGRFVEKLESLGLYDETLIVFTSDNGGLTTTTKNFTPPTSTVPLRAGKGWLYEGGIRVPLMVKIPEQELGRTVGIPTVSMDLFPTIMEAVNPTATDQQHLDGKSLWPLLKGGETILHDWLFWDYPHYHTSGWAPGQAVRMGDYKLLYSYETGSYELYNIANDIAESKNIADSEPKILEKLKDELFKLRTELGSKIPTVR